MPIQTNSLEPNLTKFPTNQPAVRKAISLAIDRTALSQQAEGGIEPPVSNASGLTLPIFQQFLSPVGGELDAQRTLRHRGRPSRFSSRLVT